MGRGNAHENSRMGHFRTWFMGVAKQSFACRSGHRENEGYHSEGTQMCNVRRQRSRARVGVVNPRVPRHYGGCPTALHLAAICPIRD